MKDDMAVVATIHMFVCWGEGQPYPDARTATHLLQAEVEMNPGKLGAVIREKGFLAAQDLGNGVEDMLAERSR